MPSKKAGAPQAENSAEFADAAYRPTSRTRRRYDDHRATGRSNGRYYAAVELHHGPRGPPRTTSRIKLIAREASWIQVRDLSTNELILSKVLLKGHITRFPAGRV